MRFLDALDHRDAEVVCFAGDAPRLPPPDGGCELDFRAEVERVPPARARGAGSPAAGRAAGPGLGLEVDPEVPAEDLQRARALPRVAFLARHEFTPSTSSTFELST